ncbi:MAG: cyclic nucleotide-binding domain-containing protein [Clostridium butyricum]|nr:cyclic nucleotide-binding domain-containing protein [Clostridium butyricum]
MKNSEYLEHNLKLKFNMETEQLIDRETLILTVEKGQIILLEGERAKSLYFIIKGIVRGYYIDEKGDEITKCFSMENEF